MKYFIKTVAGRWEEVSEYIFKNRKFILTDSKDDPRYTDSYFMTDGTTIKFNGNITLAEMGQLCRFLNVTIPTGQFGGTVGFVTKPEMLRIQRGRSRTLHQVSTGENWRKAG